MSLHVSDSGRSYRKDTVILFRTPSSENDPYETIFSDAGYRPLSIQVLSEVYEISELEEILRRGGECWENVVVSSRRGAEGWVQAAQGLNPHDPPDWSSIPLFSVGQSSTEIFASAPIPPNLMTHISPSNTAKTASHLLPNLLSSPPRDSVRYKPTLILRGDKSMDEIPEGLRQAGRIVQEVMVYKTLVAPGLGVRIREGLRGLEGTQVEAGVIWLIFFSPSSAGFAIPHLQELGYIPTRGDGEGKQDARGVKIASIGMTTKRYMEGVGISVDVIAEEPTPEGLLQAIQGYKG